MATFKKSFDKQYDSSKELKRVSSDSQITDRNVRQVSSVINHQKKCEWNHEVPRYTNQNG